MKLLDAHRAVAGLRFSSLPQLTPRGQAVVLSHLHRRHHLGIDPVRKATYEQVGGAK